MDLNEYHKKAEEFARYLSPAYPFYGLAEEAGEVLGKVAKKARKAVFSHPLYDMTDEERADIAKELGDVLWMVQACCTQLQYSLNEVAVMNLKKLRSRQERGVIVGEGDNR